MTSADRDNRVLGLPPLGLYVHLPWCVSKCPYCDFNSHVAPENLPVDTYIDALLIDLEADLPLVWGRPVGSVFIGGGTPSLFDAVAIERLISGIRGRLMLRPDVEITLEANPGTIEHDSFRAYREAGVNRVSLGVQSFDDHLLAGIGRIHGSDEARKAIESIQGSGLDNFNIDLMYGLPQQSIGQANSDLETALAYQVPHLSHYQLTLEPNTAFAANPPALPMDDDAWDMQQRASALLEQHGYRQYEVSAWARPDRCCRHNLNYWQYGDFLGIGAGAHAKLTDAATQQVVRLSKQRHPRLYLAARETGGWRAESRVLSEGDRIFEFFLNQLRLRDGVSMDDFSERTGLPMVAVEGRVREAVDRGLLDRVGERLLPTELGWRFVNETQQIFLN
jgi:putative oxygen-independent coproporphyrinogen III oxidase